MSLRRCQVQLQAAGILGKAAALGHQLFSFFRWVGYWDAGKERKFATWRGLIFIRLIQFLALRSRRGWSLPRWVRCASSSCCVGPCNGGRFAGAEGTSPAASINSRPDSGCRQIAQYSDYEAALRA